MRKMNFKNYIKNCDYKNRIKNYDYKKFFNMNLYWNELIWFQ